MADQHRVAQSRRRWAAAVAAVAVISVSCGGGDGSGGTDAVIRNQPPSDEGKPKRGGDLVYGLEAETTGGWCLPTAQLAASGIQVAGAIYDTLTIPSDDGEIVPYLAKSVEPNATYNEFTITLREGIEFHNGEQLDADAVKLNIDTYRRGTLAQFTLQDVADTQVIDPLTVKVTTKRPWIAFPAYLWATGRFGMVAPAQLADSETCDRNLIGTGPFRMFECETTDCGWTVNDKLVAERNPEYWQKDENGVQLPYLDAITFRPVPDVSARVNGLRGGELDLIHTTDGQRIRELRQDAEAGELSMVEVDRASEIGYVMFNVDQAPFDSRTARQAFAHALDREEIIEISGGGIATAADQPFDADVMGYVDPDELGYPKFDPDRAKKLVQDYEQETGNEFSFVLGGTPDPVIVKLAQLVQSQMEAVGMQVEIRNTEQTQYINQALGGDFQANLWRNHPGGDPDGQYVWWHTGSPVNFGRFSDPEIDEALEAGRSETDDATREQLYRTVSREFAQELYNAWLTYTIWAFPSRPEVKGLFGPALPDGNGRQTIRVSVQPTVGIWFDE